MPGGGGGGGRWGQTPTTGEAPGQREKRQRQFKGPLFRCTGYLRLPDKRMRWVRVSMVTKLVISISTVDKLVAEMVQGIHGNQTSGQGIYGNQARGEGIYSMLSRQEAQIQIKKEFVIGSVFQLRS